MLNVYYVAYLYNGGRGERERERVRETVVEWVGYSSFDDIRARIDMQYL